MAFFSGSTGVIYRQFSLTIASAVALSVLIALILTPALCATMLKPVAKGHHEKKRGFFGWFNRVFDRSADQLCQRRRRLPQAHGRRADLLRRHRGRGRLSLHPQAHRLSAGGRSGRALRHGLSSRPARPASSPTRCSKKMEHHFLVDEKENVEGMFGVLGFSFSGSGQNQVLVFVKLKDWEERKQPGQTVKAIQGRAMGDFMQFKDAFAFAFAPPAVLELGTATGFDVRLVDRAGVGHDGLMRRAISSSAWPCRIPCSPACAPMASMIMPEYQINIDQEKASALGLSLAGMNSAISAPSWAPLTSMISSTKAA